MAHEIYEWMEEERSQEYRASKIASLKAEEQHGKIGGGKTVHVKVEKCLKCVCMCVRKKSSTDVFHRCQPSKENQIGIIAFKGSNLAC